MSVGALIAFAAAALAGAAIFGRVAARWWMWSTVAGAIGACAAAIQVLVMAAPWEWRGGFALAGETMFLRLDAISALFLVLLAVVGQK